MRLDCLLVRTVPALVRATPSAWAAQLLFRPFRKIVLNAVSKKDIMSFFICWAGIHVFMGTDCGARALRCSPAFRCERVMSCVAACRSGCLGNAENIGQITVLNGSCMVSDWMGSRAGVSEGASVI